jgi:hypothetical protein
MVAHTVALPLRPRAESDRYAPYRGEETGDELLGST